jgi:hypothetical protein
VRRAQLVGERAGGELLNQGVVDALLAQVGHGDASITRPSPPLPTVRTSSSGRNLRVKTDSPP